MWDLRGIEPESAALEEWSRGHWTSRDIPLFPCWRWGICTLKFDDTALIISKSSLLPSFDLPIQYHQVPPWCDLRTKPLGIQWWSFERSVANHGGKGQSNQYLFFSSVVWRVVTGRGDAGEGGPILLRAGQCRGRARQVGEACRGGWGMYASLLSWYPTCQQETCASLSKWSEVWGAKKKQTEKWLSLPLEPRWRFIIPWRPWSGWNLLSLVECGGNCATLVLKPFTWGWADAVRLLPGRAGGVHPPEPQPDSALNCSRNPGLVPPEWSGSLVICSQGMVGLLSFLWSTLPCALHSGLLDSGWFYFFSDGSGGLLG